MIDKNDAWLKAISAVTAYIDNDHNTDLASELVDNYFADPNGGAEVASGRINLSGMLLYNLAKARGDASPGWATHHPERIRIAG
jgi:hypothetical protein